MLTPLHGRLLGTCIGAEAIAPGFDNHTDVVPHTIMHTVRQQTHARDLICERLAETLVTLSCLAAGKLHSRGVCQTWHWIRHRFSVIAWVSATPKLQSTGMLVVGVSGNPPPSKPSAPTIKTDL